MKGEVEREKEFEGQEDKWGWKEVSGIFGREGLGYF